MMRLMIVLMISISKLKLIKSCPYVITVSVESKKHPLVRTKQQNVLAAKKTLLEIFHETSQGLILTGKSRLSQANNGRQT